MFEITCSELKATLSTNLTESQRIEYMKYMCGRNITYRSIDADSSEKNGNPFISLH